MRTLLLALFALTACGSETPSDSAADIDTGTGTGADTDTGTDSATDTGDDSGADTADCTPTPETCNGVDDDCDGDIDEAGAVGEARFYADVDGDGFGDVSAALDACTAPDGYVSTQTDCDDRDGDVHPGQTEIANDGDDNDCDPSTQLTMNLYDAFSTTTNPSGEWSFGYATDADGTGFTLYADYAEFDASVDYWTTSGIEGARVYRNHTASDWVYATTTFAPMSLVLHPGAAGEYSAVRWTAPAATQCQVDVTFSGRDSTSTLVGVYFGGVRMDGGEVSGFGATVPLVGFFNIAAGDSVVFTVGPNGAYYFDSTGLAGTLSCR